jgi:hypothetical protein
MRGISSLTELRMMIQGESGKFALVFSATRAKGDGWPAENLLHRDNLNITIIEI